MRFRTVIAAGIVWLAGLLAASAQTTVRMLHVEQNQAVQGYWNDIAQLC